jgi:hypothetical protein
MAMEKAGNRITRAGSKIIGMGLTQRSKGENQDADVEAGC